MENRFLIVHDLLQELARRHDEESLIRPYTDWLLEHLQQHPEMEAYVAGETLDHIFGQILHHQGTHAVVEWLARLKSLLKFPSDYEYPQQQAFSKSALGASEIRFANQHGLIIVCFAPQTYQRLNHLENLSRAITVSDFLNLHNEAARLEALVHGSTTSPLASSASLRPEAQDESEPEVLHQVDPALSPASPSRATTDSDRGSTSNQPAVQTDAAASAASLEQWSEFVEQETAQVFGWTIRIAPWDRLQPLAKTDMVQWLLFLLTPSILAQLLRQQIEASTAVDLAAVSPVTNLFDWVRHFGEQALQQLSPVVFSPSDPISWAAPPGQVQLADRSFAWNSVTQSQANSARQSQDTQRDRYSAQPINNAPASGGTDRVSPEPNSVQDVPIAVASGATSDKSLPDQPPVPSTKRMPSQVPHYEPQPDWAQAEPPTRQRSILSPADNPRRDAANPLAPPSFPVNWLPARSFDPTQPLKPGKPPWSVEQPGEENPDRPVTPPDNLPPDNLPTVIPPTIIPDPDQPGSDPLLPSDSLPDSPGQPILSPEPIQLPSDPVLPSEPDTPTDPQEPEPPTEPPTEPPINPLIEPPTPPADQPIVFPNLQNTQVEIGLGSKIYILENFTGIGKGTTPDQATLNDLDVIRFNGNALVSENMRLQQRDNDLVIWFEIADSPIVILKGFALDMLDNLSTATWASVTAGNILFDGQTTIEDEFDVIDAESQINSVFRNDTVTFLNARNNRTFGFDRSDDGLHGMDGDDRLFGLSGDDTLTGGNGDDVLDGGEGDDLLDGGTGKNILIGGAGNNQFVIATDGQTTIVDFQLGRDRLQLADQSQLGQIEGKTSNGSTVLFLNNQPFATLLNIQATVSDLFNPS